MRRSECLRVLCGEGGRETAATAASRVFRGSRGCLGVE